MTIGSLVLVYYISVGGILSFTIGSTSSAFLPLGVWVAARQAWCFVIFSVVKGGVCVYYWNLHGWMLWMIVWKLPMFKKGRHSCGPERTFGFHGSSSSSFLNYHTNYWASSLDHYYFAGHSQSQLPLGWMTGCGDHEGCSCSILYHQNGFHVHHRRALGNLREKINVWR